MRQFALTLPSALPCHFLADAGRETARETLEYLYGTPIDIDKVWEDRDALHDASMSMQPKSDKGKACFPRIAPPPPPQPTEKRLPPWQVALAFAAIAGATAAIIYAQI